MQTVVVDGRDAGIYAQMAHFVKGHPKCGHIHGHSVSLSVEITGEIGPDGFVVDFSEVKKMLKDILERIDHHGIVVAREDLEVFPDRRAAISFRGDELISLPASEVCELDVPATTAEAMAKWALGSLRASLWGGDLTRIELTYWETKSTGGVAVWERPQ
jgi:6-pyruvoyltetrahydropterin/6-carboxytetrahydropterin synthase